jgi:hypothetical protein
VNNPSSDLASPRVPNWVHRVNLVLPASRQL